jgi:hypothetical protein
MNTNITIEEYEKCMLHGKYDEFLHEEYVNNIPNAIFFFAEIIGNVNNNNIQELNTIKQILVKGIDLCIVNTNYLPRLIKYKKYNYYLIDKIIKNTREIFSKSIIDNYDTSKISDEEIDSLDIFGHIKNICVENKNYFMSKFVNNYLFIPSGWTKHAVSVLIHKIEDKYNIFIINSGDGAHYNDNNVIGCIKNSTEDNLFNLICVIVYHVEFDSNKTTYYEKIFEYFNITKIEKHESPVNTNVLQCAGTCSYYSIYYLVKLLCYELQILPQFDVIDKYIKEVSQKEIIEKYKDCNDEESLLFIETFDHPNEKIDEYRKTFKNNVLSYTTILNFNENKQIYKNMVLELFYDVPDDYMLIYEPNTTMKDKINKLYLFVEEFNNITDITQKYINILINKYINRLYESVDKNNLLDVDIVTEITLVCVILNSKGMKGTMIKICFLLLKIINLNNKCNENIYTNTNTDSGIYKYENYYIIEHVLWDNTDIFCEEKTLLLTKYYNLIFMFYFEKSTCNINYEIYNKFLNDTQISFGEESTFYKKWICIMFLSILLEDEFNINKSNVLKQIRELKIKENYEYSYYFNFRLYNALPQDYDLALKNNIIYDNNVELLNKLINNVTMLNKYFNIFKLYRAVYMVTVHSTYTNLGHINVNNKLICILNDPLELYNDETKSDKIYLNDTFGYLNIGIFNMYKINKNIISEIVPNLKKNFNELNDFTKLAIFFMIVHYECYNTIDNEILKLYESFFDGNIIDDYKDISIIMKLLMKVMSNYDIDIIFNELIPFMKTHQLFDYMVTPHDMQIYDSTYIYDPNLMFKKLIKYFIHDIYDLIIANMSYDNIINLLCTYNPIINDIRVTYTNIFNKKISRIVPLTNIIYNIIDENSHNNYFLAHNAVLKFVKNSDEQLLDTFIINNFVFKINNYEMNTRGKPHQFICTGFPTKCHIKFNLQLNIIIDYERRYTTMNNISITYENDKYYIIENTNFEKYFGKDYHLINYNENVYLLYNAEHDKTIIWYANSIYNGTNVTIHKHDQYMYLNDDKSKKIVNNNCYMYNIWIHNIKHSYILYNDYTHKYYIFIIKPHNIILNDKYVNPKNINVQKKTPRKCYIIEISYNGLYLKFSRETTKDLECYMKLCIIYTKIICMKKIFYFFIRNVNQKSKLYTNYINKSIYNNLFAHYFKYLKNEYDYVENARENSIFDMSRYIQTNKYPKIFNLCKETYNFDNVEYNPFNNIDTGIHDNNFTIYYENVSKIFGIVNKDKIDIDHLCKELESYININKKLSDCKIKTIDDGYKNIFIEKIKQLENDIDNNITDLYETRNILDNYKKYYNLLEIRLLFDVLLEVNREGVTCVEIKKLYDKINKDILYKGNRTINIVFFEIIHGYFIRNEQYIIVKDIIDKINNYENNNNYYNLYQLLMGKGKTSTITPLIMLYYVYNIKNIDEKIILLMPKRLIHQSITDISHNMYILQHNFLMHICKIDNYTFLFGKNNYLKIKNNINNILKQYDINYTNSIPTVILADDGILKEIYLHINKYNNIDDINIDDINIDDINNEIARQSISKSIIITDEFDSLYNPLSSDLLMPKKTKKLREIDIFTSNDIEYLINIIYKIVDKTKLGDNISIDTIKKIAKNNVLTKDTININIDNNIDNNNNDNNNDNNDTTDMFNYYIHNYGKFNGLKYYNLFMVIVECYKMTYNKEYGLPQNNSHSHNLYAVPYNFVNTPVINSEFSAIDIKIILTIFSYAYLKKTTKYIINECLFYLLNKKKAMFSLFESTLIKKQLKPITDLIGINCEFLDNYDAKYAQYYADNIDPANVDKFNKYVIQNILIYNMEIDMSFLKCSFINIIDNNFSLRKCGFSGTLALKLPCYNDTLLDKYYEEKNIIFNNDLNLYYKYDTSNLNTYNLNNHYRNIIYNKLDNDEITTAIYGCINKNIPNLIYIEDNKLKTNILEYINTDGYDALIDCGAFLKQYKNIEVAEHVCKIHKQCIFIDTNLENNDIVYILTLTDKKYEIRIYDTSATMEQPIFIYYDNKHTVGVNIKQSINMRGLCTVGNFNNLTEISQGIYRLRNINYGHEIDFIVTENIYSEIQNNDNEYGLRQRVKLYNYLKKNDEQMIKNNDIKLIEQCYFTLEENQTKKQIEIENYIYYKIIKEYNFNKDISPSFYLEKKIRVLFKNNNYISLSKLFNKISKQINNVLNEHHKNNIIKVVVDEEKIKNIIKKHYLVQNIVTHDQYEIYTRELVKKMCDISHTSYREISTNMNINVNKNINININKNINVNKNININIDINKNIKLSLYNPNKYLEDLPISLKKYIDSYSTNNLINNILDSKYYVDLGIYISIYYSHYNYVNFIHDKHVNVIDIIHANNAYYYMNGTNIVVISYNEYIILSRFDNIKQYIYYKYYDCKGDIDIKSKHLFIQMLIGRSINIDKFIYVMYYIKKTFNNIANIIDYIDKFMVYLHRYKICTLDKSLQIYLKHLLPVDKKTSSPLVNYSGYNGKKMEYFLQDVFGENGENIDIENINIDNREDYKHILYHIYNIEMT